MSKPRPRLVPADSKLFDPIKYYTQADIDKLKTRIERLELAVEAVPRPVKQWGRHDIPPIGELVYLDRLLRGWQKAYGDT